MGISTSRSLDDRPWVDASTLQTQDVPIIVADVRLHGIATLRTPEDFGDVCRVKQSGERVGLTLLSTLKPLKPVGGRLAYLEALPGHLS